MQHGFNFVATQVGYYIHVSVYVFIHINSLLEAARANDNLFFKFLKLEIGFVIIL